MLSPNAEIVRSARLAKRWSQYKLAVAAGVHPQTVSAFERGISVSGETAQKLASALGLKAPADRTANGRP